MSRLTEDVGVGKALLIYVGLIGFAIIWPLLDLGEWLAVQAKRGLMACGIGPRSWFRKGGSRG